MFAIDVRVCPRCGGRTRVLSVPPPPDASRAILQLLESHAPPLLAPRPDELLEAAPVMGD